jgi:hypothetical protein
VVEYSAIKGEWKVAWRWVVGRLARNLARPSSWLLALGWVGTTEGSPRCAGPSSDRKLRASRREMGLGAGLQPIIDPSIDITMAYLQADLDEDLFMRPPPNVHPFDSENRPIVCKLRRSLYGLRQAGRVWAILFAS